MDRHLTNSKLEPKHVITVYSDRNSYNHYLEARKVVPTKGAYVIGAACPLSDGIFKEIAASYMKREGHNMDFGGIVPEHIVYADHTPGNTVVIWYRPAMERVLNFSAQLKIPGNKRVKVPALLGAVVNESLYYFALMTNDRPIASTPLYNAPFFNISGSGRVCLGTAPVGVRKAKTFPLEVERFENGFFVAEQNHGNMDGCKTPLKQLWPKLIKSRGEFPSKRELVANATFKTLGDFINHLKKNKLNHADDE